MQEAETLKFRIGLSGTYWDKKPQYCIAVSGKEYVKEFITSESGVVEYIEFTADLTGINNVLEISLLNKEQADTVKDNNVTDTFVILKDLLLNIESIEIDGIDLGQLRYSKSAYKLDTPHAFNNEVISSLKECVNLGWNGTYLLPFTSPFYIWLLENL